MATEIGGATVVTFQEYTNRALARSGNVHPDSYQSEFGLTLIPSLTDSTVLEPALLHKHRPSTRRDGNGLWMCGSLHAVNSTLVIPIPDPEYWPSALEVALLRTADQYRVSSDELEAAGIQVHGILVPRHESDLFIARRWVVDPEAQRVINEFCSANYNL